jgi:hypothetical protein
MSVQLPRGELVRSRVVSDPATALAVALDRRLTGYAVLEPQETLLLDGDAAGVLTFEAGVPTVAYHTGTDRGGPAALADLAEPGPYRADLYALAPADLSAVHDAADLRVPPGMAAERLGGDPDLAARTRAAAPDDRREDEGETDPVASFLGDEEKIRAIQQRAREEARRRAEEWGLDDELA